MPVYLLDTTVVSDLMRENQTAIARVQRETGAIMTSVIVWGEIRYGLERLAPGPRQTALENKAQHLFSILHCEAVTQTVGAAYGRLKREVELLALPLNDNDLWIAATAISLGAILVTRDSDFLRIPNLQHEDWSR